MSAAAKCVANELDENPNRNRQIKAVFKWDNLLTIVFIELL